MALRGHTTECGKSLLIVLACLCLAGQPIPPDEIHSRTVPYVFPSRVTLRTEVRVVEVPVVVRDEKFRAVAGLSRDDFEVYDDGKKQAITAFSVQNFKPSGGTPAVDTSAQKGAPQPRFLALCFDDLHMRPNDLVPVKAAAERFVRTSLAPGDRVVIVRTSKSEKVNFTSDVPTLVERIANVTPYLRAVSEDLTQCPARFDPYEAYRVAEHMDPGDRVLNAKIAQCMGCMRADRSGCEGLVSGMAKAIWAYTRLNTVNSLGVIQDLVDGLGRLPGQRVILLTTGGFLTGTLEADVDRLMEKARHAEVIINGLDARGLFFNASAGMAYDGMGVLASGTGGTFFHNNNDIDGGFRELGMVPEVSYVLGFAPTGKTDGSFHKLKVRLAARKAGSVEARLGYTAPANASETPVALSRVDIEIMASDRIADLPISFNWEQWAGSPSITMVAHLDIRRLHFKPYQNRRTQKLIVVAVLLDDSGNFVAGKQSELQLSFKDATFEQFEKSGFTAALTINAPPGHYSVRAVAQDAMEGKLAAASDIVRIN